MRQVGDVVRLLVFEPACGCGLFPPWPPNIFLCPSWQSPFGLLVLHRVVAGPKWKLLRPGG